VIGRRVSHFYIIRSLGSGGMGIVYEAQDTRLPRSVAVKFLKPTLSRDTEAIRRFKREARLASSLNHPNICTVLDVDEGDGLCFIAMELLRGRSLKERLSAGSIGLDEVLSIAIQAADALANAHDHGIVHRDITPGNIFLTDAGLVKLLDFGLAKSFGTSADDGSVSDDMTETGALVGTLHYMAPERLQSDAPVNQRADLFSLGAVLYEMATGAKPFEAKSRHEITALIQEQPQIPLRRLAPHHPIQLELIVDRLLAKRPDDRYESAWLLRADLEAVQRETSRLQPPAARGTGAVASIAVLPFESIGDGARSVAFRDGLVEDLTARLSGLRGLRVAPRTSIRSVASLSAREIGVRLNVQTLVEGSIQQVGERLRVIATLVDAATEQPVVPAVRLDRQFDELLSVQDEIAREIADRIAAAFAARQDRPPTQDAEAYHAYKRGQHHWRTRFAGGWRQAIEQFQYAVQRDNGFALAHVALASAYEFLGFYTLMKPNLAFAVARRSVDRALELDDRLAQAHTELALIRFGGDWDWEGAEDAFRRALELDPNDPIAHVCYAWLLVLLGREDAAIAEAKAGCALAPASRFVTCGMAQTLYLARRYDQTIELCDECLRHDPDYVFAVSLRGQCYELKGMFREAVADLEHSAALSLRAPFYVGMLGHCYGEAGMRAQALDLIADLKRQSREMYVPPQCYVYVYAGLGERSKALAHQERAYEDGASPFNYFAPSIRDLYALDPQQRRRLEQMRLII